MRELENLIRENTKASFENDRLAHFGDPVAEFLTLKQGSAKCPLLSLGVVAISGDDTAEFINGQFTTDCSNLNRHHTQLSAWCDPKGRVLFLFILLTDGERHFAILPRSQIDAFCKRLKMFVLRAAVEISDVSEQFFLIGFGATLPAGFSGPAVGWQVNEDSSNRRLLRYADGTERYVAVLSADVAHETWSASDLLVVGEDAWLGLDYLEGIPHLAQDRSGDYLPQHLNLDALDALSFKKGCFPGQEIIARLRYRGEVKKRLIAAEISSANPVVANTAVILANEQRKVGDVLASARIGPQRFALSAVVDVAANGGQSLSLDGYGEAQLHRIALPYETP